MMKNTIKFHHFQYFRFFLKNDIKIEIKKKCCF